MRGLRPCILACVVAALAGCGGAKEEHATTRTDASEIDLTTLTAPGAESPRTLPPTRRIIVQEPHRTLELFLRLPAESRLLFALPDGVGDETFAVSVESATGHERLRFDEGTGGERSASLARFDEQPVRLRLENHAPTPLEWRQPRVVGVARPVPPILERPAVERPLNVLLYVVDTLRADRLSAYGYGRPTSPRLEEIAARGVLFEQAYSVGSSTGPSITALFASRFPSELGVRLAAGGPAERTLAEVFHEAGYATAAFQANFALIEQLGFGRGFDIYRRLKLTPPEGPCCVRAEALNALARDWMREHRERPFFVYVQSMDVHNYDPPPPWRGKFTVQSTPDPALVERLRQQATPQLLKILQTFGTMDPNKYDETIAYTDHEIGALVDTLAELGIADRTVVVVTADHGEPLFQRGQFFHGMSLHEEVTRIPLLMLIPARAAGVRRSELVSLMDLAPTLVDLVGLPVPERFIGRSLLRPGTTLDPPRAFGEQPKAGSYSWFAREANWKLLMEPQRAELYELTTDPGETRDVAAEHPIETGYLTSLLRLRVPMLRDGAPGAPPHDAVLTPEARQELHEALKALGYVQ